MFRLILISVLVAIVAARSPRVRPVVPQLDGRIVGGSPSSIEKRPHQISLQYFGSHICGGSLISNNRVLTAAHCTDGMSASSLRIRAGSSYHGSGGQLVSVRSICQHPRYSPSTTDNDVSVLILAGSVTPGSGVQTIPLQPVNVEVPLNTLATVSGWGTTSEGGSIPSSLLEVDVPRVSDATCKAAYGSSAITARMVCFGWTSGGRDSCQGDSGGPLVVGSTQVAVVSWGYGCARPNYPGVYAKISESTLRSHIDSCRA